MTITEEHLMMITPEEQNEIEKITVKDIATTSLSSSMVGIIHEALDSYPVMIYNGQENPQQYQLGTALTSISLDLRKVKIQGIENADLLSGMKQRREAVKLLSGAFVKYGEYFGFHKKWKIIIFILQTSASAYGFYELISKLFFPTVPTPKK